MLQHAWLELWTVEDILATVEYGRLSINARSADCIDGHHVVFTLTTAWRFQRSNSSSCSMANGMDLAGEMDCLGAN
jgi:hypothetical protein